MVVVEFLFIEGNPDSQKALIVQQLAKPVGDGGPGLVNGFTSFRRGSWGTFIKKRTRGKEWEFTEET